MSRILIRFIEVYRLTVSPFLPPGTCRFHPTCSQYAIDAVTKHGPFMGLWKGAVRILKCHPWHPGGFDPA